jgi:hypothetical protein
MRAAAEPEATLLTFFEAAYLAGARAAQWEIEGLTRRSGTTSPRS